MSNWCKSFLSMKTSLRLLILSKISKTSEMLSTLALATICRLTFMNTFMHFSDLFCHLKSQWHQSATCYFTMWHNSQGITDIGRVVYGKQSTEEFISVQWPFDKVHNECKLSKLFVAFVECLKFLKINSSSYYFDKY